MQRLERIPEYRRKLGGSFQVGILQLYYKYILLENKYKIKKIYVILNMDAGRAHGHRKTDRSRMVGGLSDFASFGLRGMRRLFKGQEEKRI